VTTRHAPTATPRTTRVTSTADRVTKALPMQKARCRNTGPTLQVGQPHPSRQAKRKGVTVVPDSSHGSPVRPSTAPRVASEVAA
jgi:hypothetical protein